MEIKQNYSTRYVELYKPNIIQLLSFFTLVFAINLYSLMVPFRIIFSNNIYILMEFSVLFSLVFLICMNIIRQPNVLYKYHVEIALIFLIILSMLIGTLAVRGNAPIFQLASYMRLILAPLIASILVLTSEFERTTFNKKQKWLYIPAFALFISLLSSLIQMVKPEVIQKIVMSNWDFIFAGQGTNFIRGSIYNRLIGIFFDPNVFGGFLVLNILFIFIYFSNKKRLFKGYIIIFPLILALFFTVSRSAIITLLFCFIVYFLIGSVASKVKPLQVIKYLIIFTFVIILLIIIGTGIFSILNLSFSELLRTRFLVDINQISTLNGRTSEWYEYLGEINTPLAFLFGINSEMIVNVTSMSIENTFIGILVKYGFLCFILLILYTTRLVKKSKANTKDKGIIIFFLILSSLGSDIDTLQHITVPLFIYLALMKSGIFLKQS